MWINTNISAILPVVAAPGVVVVVVVGRFDGWIVPIMVMQIKE